MTITAGITEISYAGDNASTVFPVPFPFHDETDLLIVLTAPDGTAQTLTSGFTITGGAGETGDVTLDAPLASGYTLTIADNPELSQQVDYISNDAFPAETHEFALDKLTRLIKRMSRQVARSLRAQDGEPTVSPIPPAASRADQFFMFDSLGRPSVSALPVASRAGRLMAFDQSGNPTTLPVVVPGPGLAPGAYISVKDFGAKGDGVTDDTAAFNAASAAAPVAAEIYVPSGTYILDGAVLKYGQTLRGPGTLKWKSGVSGTTPMITVESGGRLVDLTIDGNKTANASVVGNTNTVVQVTGRGSRIESVDFINVPSACIVTDASIDAADGVIVGCNFKHTNRYCVIIRAPRWRVIGCSFFGTGINDGHAIRFGRFFSDPSLTVEGGVVAGCTFKYVNSAAVLCELSSKNISITGNVISFCSAPFKVEGQVGEEASGVVISGNYFEECQYVIDYDENTETAVQTAVGSARAGLAGFMSLCANNIFYRCPGLSIGNGSSARGNKFIDCHMATTVPNGPIAMASGGGSVVDCEFIHSDNPSVNAVIHAPYPSNISGCVIRGYDATYGINLSGAGHRVARNVIDGAGTGVRLVSDVTDSHVVDNSFENCTITVIPNQGTITNTIRNPGAPDLYSPLVAISAGEITVSGGLNRVSVDTESGSGSDDLDTISGGVTGQVLTLNQVSGTRDVTVKTGSGNIYLSGGDFTIDTTTESITLRYDGSKWCEVARSK